MYNSGNKLETIELLILTECTVWRVDYILVQLRLQIDR